MAQTRRGGELDHRDDAAAGWTDRRWLANLVVVLVVGVWAVGAVGQLLIDHYTQPYWVHAIAGLTVSVVLTGRLHPWSRGGESP